MLRGVPKGGKTHPPTLTINITFTFTQKGCVKGKKFQLTRDSEWMEFNYRIEEREPFYRWRILNLRANR